jgi:hypothetical protein
VELYLHFPIRFSDAVLAHTNNFTSVKEKRTLEQFTLVNLLNSIAVEPSV